MTYAYPTREQAATLDDRAEWPHPIHQWGTPTGAVDDAGLPVLAPRYVLLRALSVRDKADAERAARKPSRQGDGAIDPWRLMVEEVRRGIIRPADLPADVIYGWNVNVVMDIYNELQRVGGYASARISAALEALAGEPDPPRPGAAAAGESDHDPDDLGGDDRPAARGDDGEPAGDAAR